MKERKAITKEEEMTETTRDIKITKTKIRNLVILLKKKLILNLMIMMKKLSMFP